MIFSGRLHLKNQVEKLLKNKCNIVTIILNSRSIYNKLPNNKLYNL